MSNTKKNPAFSQCAICGQKSARQTRQSRIYGEGAGTVIIENVPVMNCSACESEYLDPSVSELIDQILDNPSHYTTPEIRPVARVA
ncbi:MAG: type II toxin-antitoxin system MqsA family antitoxin [Blastocatellia bacterium]